MPGQSKPLGELQRPHRRIDAEEAHQESTQRIEPQIHPEDPAGSSPTAYQIHEDAQDNEVEEQLVSGGGMLGKGVPERVARSQGIGMRIPERPTANPWRARGGSPLIRSPIRPTPCPSMRPMPPRSAMAGNGRRARNPEIIPPDTPPRIPPQTAMPPDHTSNTRNGIVGEQPPVIDHEYHPGPKYPPEDRPHRYRVDVFDSHAGPGRVKPGYPVSQQDSERREQRVPRQRDRTDREIGGERDDYLVIQQSLCLRKTGRRVIQWIHPLEISTASAPRRLIQRLVGFGLSGLGGLSIGSNSRSA